MVEVKNERMIATWKCEMIDERMRPSGQKIRPGCRYMNMTKTRRRNGNRKNKWQDKCKFCGRKKNLHAGIVEWLPIEEDYLAENRCRMHNRDITALRMKKRAEASQKRAEEMMVPIAQEDYIPPEIEGLV